MKTPLLLLFLIAVLTATGQQAAKGAHYKTIRKIVTDINDDGKMDTIIISSSLNGYSEFNRVSVALAGFKKRTFYANDSWTDVDTSFLKENKNAVRSNLLFLKKTSKHGVILLFGVQDGAGYRGEFSILNIENNEVKMVLDDKDLKLDIETPIALTDLNNDQRLDFIYRITFQCDQAFANGMVCAYSPFFVYAVDDTCKLNKPLMKAYNQKNYVFEGYAYSEKIPIFYPKDGSRPSLWHDPKKRKR